MSGATVRCKFVPGVKSTPGKTAPKVARSSKPSGPSRTARMLALAHHVEREIEAGIIPDYAAAARALGVTRARLTQIMNLLLLAPEIQERLLLSTLVASERSLRRVMSEASWVRQLAALPSTDKAQREPE